MGRTAANVRNLGEKQSWLHTCAPHPRGVAWPLRGLQSTEAVALTEDSAALKSVASTHTSAPKEARSNFSRAEIACCAQDDAHLAAKKIPAPPECDVLSKDASDVASTEASSCACSELAEEFQERVLEPLVTGPSKQIEQSRLELTFLNQSQFSEPDLSDPSSCQQDHVGASARDGQDVKHLNLPNSRELDVGAGGTAAKEQKSGKCSRTKKRGSRRQQR